MYSEILKTAARYANQHPDKPGFLQGDTFYPPVHDNKLELWYTPEEVDGAIQVAKARGLISSEQEVYDKLTQVVVDSLQSAIVDHKQEFAALIVENLRRGQDPFNVN